MALGVSSLLDQWNGTSQGTGAHPESTYFGTEQEKLDDPLGKSLAFLEKTFGTTFAVFDAAEGRLLQAPICPKMDWEQFSVLSRVVSNRRQPEITWEEDPLAILAIPLLAEETSRVAMGLFALRTVGADECLGYQAASLGTSEASLREWASGQRAWAPEVLLQVARACYDHFAVLDRLQELEAQSDEMSMHLAAVYEEISLLHRLTKNLRLSKTDEELAKIAIDWLTEVVPAEGIAILLLPVAQDHDGLPGKIRTSNVLLRSGQVPLSAEQFRALMEEWSVRRASDPLVRNFLNSPFDYHGYAIRNVIAVPVAEGENLFGYLAAFNHRSYQQFGSMEANLLLSVATLIGIHSGNLELYRQQSELLAGVVRALTSAIDAKDPYTCGHSDRVARLAVRLAQELGYPPEVLPRVYLAGLLHDIGKIGVNDAILQKPGKLTEEEYDHIKTHVEKGHRILSGLKQLDDILPVVLYHHESWDGNGYPHKLAGEAIPPLARIVAVADAYDAMASNRPYRNRMPNDKIDEIIRNGAGRQWDPQVVEAFFRARDDLRQIADEKDLLLIDHPLLGPIIRKSLGMTNTAPNPNGSSEPKAANDLANP